ARIASSRRSRSAAGSGERSSGMVVNPPDRRLSGARGATPARAEAARRWRGWCGPSDDSPPGPQAPEDGAVPGPSADPPASGPGPRPASGVVPAAWPGRWARWSRTATTPPAALRTPPGPPPATTADPRPSGRSSGPRRPAHGPGSLAANPHAGRRSRRGTGPSSGVPSTGSAGPDRRGRAGPADADRAGAGPGGADTPGMPPEPDLGHRGAGPSRAPPGDLDVTSQADRPRPQLSSRA